MEKKVEDVGSLKEGRFAILEDEPCTIVDIKTSKTGKHGHAKSRIEGIGLITGKKHVIILPTHDKIEVPIVEKRDAQVLMLRENVAQVMDMKTFETIELQVPEELKSRIREGSQVVYWEVMGHKLLKEVRG
ncbi:MAG: translation initiation factor IF-5A [Candidatus Parvarchaeota archaeon]|nr:translation initiation factor IF-5A [Candidatus Jingweiarchaeum tengchongense]MCW1298395.1 translation initiation factor IF-5A [Candidatus Jingweiarchaeum tengchongense]MCW1300303.1 translation initiation factor IF-5A [Candidatus Jingweiarchaeum tengchongense]MCW1304901.1 translation initiation factor IF-5A [Candidatus Jingweiarchaeum tengchongense]MCW1305799.1 translation initiation factor IF-5A [Candidatus Jingweiarchaeum tengchongense]